MFIVHFSVCLKFFKILKMQVMHFPLYMSLCFLGRCVSTSAAGPARCSAPPVRGTEGGEHSHREGQAPAALPLLGPHVLILEVTEPQPQQPGNIPAWEIVSMMCLPGPGLSLSLRKILSWLILSTLST